MKKKYSLKETMAKMKAEYGAYIDPWQQYNPNPIQYPQQPQFQMQAPAAQTDMSGNIPNFSPAPKNEQNLIPNKSYQPIQLPQNTAGLDFNGDQIKDKGKSTGQKVGALIGSVGKAAGQVLHDVINGAPQLLNAIIPDQPQRKNKYVAPTYDPFSMGTGSQAIYDKGGIITKRQGKKKNIITTEAGDSYPTESTYMNPSPANMLPVDNTFTPSQQYVPQPNPSYEFFPDFDVHGNLTSYTPNFNNASYGDARNMFSNIPDTYNGYPTTHTEEAYKDMYQNFGPQTQSYQWKPYKDPSQGIEPSIIDYPEFKDGGKINIKKSKNSKKFKH